MGDEKRKAGQLLDNSHGADASNVSGNSFTDGLPTSSIKGQKNGSKADRPGTFPYFKHLPYDVEDESERQKNFDEIISHLYVALEAGDFAPGAVHWTRELRSWLGLKFRPTKEQRIKLIKLYYELALSPGIDLAVLERFASMFMVLTKYVCFPGPMLL